MSFVWVTKSSSAAVFLRVFWHDAAKNGNLRLRYSNRRADSARRPAGFLDLSHMRR